MKTRAHHGFILFNLLLAFVLLGPIRALAQDDANDDPPSRVARLSFVQGQVSFSPAGTDDWVAAVLNRPITTDDKIWADQDSRAELSLGSSALRIGDQTGFSFLNLDDHMMQIRLTEGTLSLRVRRLEQDESIEIDTPNLAFTVLRPGRYRLNVNEAGDTTIIDVRDGNGEVTGGGSAFTVHPDQQGVFTGTDSLDADIEPLPGPDDFDSWCDERDLREDHSAARRYVSDDVIGYEDLDEYGGWRNVPDYGTVWFPHVTVVGWAPYRYGHWVWISPWGWTWVDDAPWGFAPFHYGRWVFVGGGWGWVPCPPRAVAVAYVRPVYAPALVAWVGGPHFAVGIGVGGGGYGPGVNVGWFPLGPREVYVPSYRVSRRYVNNVNISNTTVNQTVINNYYNATVINKNVTVNNVRYVNQGVPGGVTAISAQTFTSARPVGRNMVVVDRREIAAAPAVYRAPEVVPPRQAVLGTGAMSNVHPPAGVQNRPVVARTAPPPPTPSFAVRQAAIEKNQGRPLSIAETRQLQTAQPHNNVMPVRIAPPAQPGTPRFNSNQQGGNRVNAAPGRQDANRPPGNMDQPNPQIDKSNRVPNVGQPNSGQPNPQVNQPNRPAKTQPSAPANTQTNAPANPRVYTDRPPASPTLTPVDPQLEQKHQQQIEQLQQKQDQQYQKLQQKQVQEQQKVQQRQMDQQKQQQVQQKEQQQLQRLEQKQNQQQQTLRQKQEADHAKAYKEPPQSKPKENKQQDKPADKQHH